MNPKTILLRCLKSLFHLCTLYLLSRALKTCLFEGEKEEDDGEYDNPNDDNTGERQAEHCT